MASSPPGALAQPEQQHAAPKGEKCGERPIFPAAHAILLTAGRAAAWGRAWPQTEADLSCMGLAARERRFK